VATATIGTPDLSPESLIANEIGYRANLSPKTSIDVSTFYNIYRDLIYLAPGPAFVSSAFGSPILVDPTYYRNGDSGETFGLETTGRFTLTPKARAEVGYTLLGSGHFVQGTPLGSSHNQATLHLAWDPSRNLEIDGVLHWYDAVLDQSVPAYVKLDLHLGWRLKENLYFGLGAYDLLAPRHVEFGEGTGNYIARSYIAQLDLHF
jgi:outer membrane receptor protein involved in Fe transport